MKKFRFIVIILIIFSSFIITGCEENLKGDAIGVLKEDLNFEEYLMEYFNVEDFPSTPFERTKDYKRIQKRKVEDLKYFDEKKDICEFYIILPSELENSLRNTLEEYIGSIKKDYGYCTNKVFCDDCSPQEIRNKLIEGYDHGLKGALLIGDVPLAWINFGPYEYPTTYYYMDLDGIWEDTNHDGLFDSHEGHKEPEIFVSTLKSNNLTLINQNEVSLLKKYFKRVYDYKEAKKKTEWTSIDFRDDVMGISSESPYFSENFPFIKEYDLLEHTSVSDYKHLIKGEYEFAYVHAHSNPWVHGLSEYDELGQGCEWYNPPLPNPNAVCYNSFQNTDLIKIEPKALFYFLKGCSVGRITEENNLANWYILHPDGGLLAMAPTEVIASNYDSFDTYLPYLIEGKSFGESFLHPAMDYSLKYMLVMIGDPFLKIKLPILHHKMNLEEYYYVGKHNEFEVEINTYSEGMEEEVELKLLVNEEVVGKHNLLVESPGDIINITLNLTKLGLNNIVVCISSARLGDEYCIHKYIEGYSPPIIIEVNNTYLNCEKEGLNPRMGNDETNGIIINNKENVTIENCNLSGFWRNIKISDSKSIVIKNNWLAHTDGWPIRVGLYVDEKGGESNNIDIINNEFKNVNRGIISNNLKNSLIHNNIFIGDSNQFLFQIKYGLNNTIRSNYVCANLEYGAQMICEGNPINEEESFGNNWDTHDGCTKQDWPIYETHFEYCNNLKNNTYIVSRR